MRGRQIRDEIAVLLGEPQHGPVNLPVEGFRLDAELADQRPDDVAPVAERQGDQRLEGRSRRVDGQPGNHDDHLPAGDDLPLKIQLKVRLGHHDGGGQPGQRPRRVLAPERAPEDERRSGGDREAGEDERARIHDVQVIPPEGRLLAPEDQDRHAHPQEQERHLPSLRALIGADAPPAHQQAGDAEHEPDAEQRRFHMVEDPESGEEGGGPVGREDEAAQRRREEEQEVPDDAGEAVERGQALRGRAEPGEAVADVPADLLRAGPGYLGGGPDADAVAGHLRSGLLCRLARGAPVEQAAGTKHEGQ